MTTLLLGLLLTLIVSLMLWSVETYWLQPKRQAAQLSAFRSGSLDATGLAVALQTAPAWVDQVRWAASGSLLAMLFLALTGRVDIDFSLVLVVATLLCGIGWGLDILTARRGRIAGLKALGADASYPAVEVLKAEPLLVEYAHSFFPVLAVVLVLRSFLVEPFTIPSGSMLPTLEEGDYILVNKYAYGLRLPVTGLQIVPVGKPQRGDVMVFRFPPKPTTNYIKRVIGIPGDHVRTTVDGDLYINGQLMARRLVSQEPEIDPWQQYYEEDLTGVKHITRQEVGTENRRRVMDVVIPEGHYFMMGDNRDNSHDGRYWCQNTEMLGCMVNPADNSLFGTVPERMIVGKAVYIWIHKDSGLHLPTFRRNGPVE